MNIFGSTTENWFLIILCTEEELTQLIKYGWPMLCYELTVYQACSVLTNSYSWGRRKKLPFTQESREALAIDKCNCQVKWWISHSFLFCFLINNLPNLYFTFFSSKINIHFTEHNVLKLDTATFSREPQVTSLVFKV